MARNEILFDVETAALQPGDIVIRDEEPNVFVRSEEIPNSDYVRLYWGAGNYQTTAQPWNTWPIVVRLLIDPRIDQPSS